MKTVEAPEREDGEAEDDAFNPEDEKDNESSLYQHVKEGEKGTTETVDAATEVWLISTSKEKYNFTGLI